MATIGATAHQLKGNLTPCPTGPTIISSNKKVQEFERNKNRGSGIALKMGYETLEQLPLLKLYSTSLTNMKLRPLINRFKTSSTILYSKYHTKKA